jgi:hypothetical protein
VKLLVPKTVRGSGGGAKEAHCGFRPDTHWQIFTAPKCTKRKTNQNFRPIHLSQNRNEVCGTNRREFEFGGEI